MISPTVNMSIGTIKSVDTVSHPPYYNIGKIEVIDFIEDQQLGFHLGNAVKYICRAGKKVSETLSRADIGKATITDLEKAVWYLNRHIRKLRGEV